VEEVGKDDESEDGLVELERERSDERESVELGESKR